MVERKRTFERCRCTLEILKFNIKQAEWEDFYWLQEPLKALVNMVMLMICTIDRAISQYEWYQI